MNKGIAVILVVALSLAGLSGCAALDAAHMAWQGMVILGNIKIPQSSAPKQAADQPSEPAAKTTNKEMAAVVALGQDNQEDRGDQDQ